MVISLFPDCHAQKWLLKVSPGVRGSLGGSSADFFESLTPRCPGAMRAVVFLFSQFLLAQERSFFPFPSIGEAAAAILWQHFSKSTEQFGSVPRSKRMTSRKRSAGISQKGASFWPQTLEKPSQREKAHLPHLL